MPRKSKKKTKKKVVKKRSEKRVSKKKTTRKAKAKKTAPKSKGIPSSRVIGIVTHYFPHVEAAVIKLKKPLSVGDTVLIKGHTTSFEQKIESMQVDHVPIQKAKKGDEIGLMVSERVREHDLVLFPE